MVLTEANLGITVALCGLEDGILFVFLLPLDSQGRGLNAELFRGRYRGLERATLLPRHAQHGFRLKQRCLRLANGAKTRRSKKFLCSTIEVFVPVSFLFDILRV